MLQFTREFRLPAWDDSTWQTITSYWTSRGFRCDGVQDNILRGTRGSLLGNCISFNMNRLKTDLVVERIHPDQCRCAINVNAVFQVITEYNKAHWRLELDTFESFMLRGDLNLKEWQQCRARSVSSDILVVLCAVAIAAIVGTGAGVLSRMIHWLF